MTYLQVKGHYIDEELEFALATQKQVTRLCKEVGNDHPQMLYDSFKEELDFLVAELNTECFGG